MTDAILALLILLPAIITFFLKSNAALGFLALATGYFIESLAGTDVNNLVTKAGGGIQSVNIYLILLIAPLLLTLLFSGRAWAGKPKMILNIIAALAAGGVLAFVSMPFLGSIINLNLSSSKIWTQLQHIQSSLIIFGALYSLVLIWFSKTKHPSGKHKK